MFVIDNKFLVSHQIVSVNCERGKWTMLQTNKTNNVRALKITLHIYMQCAPDSFADIIYNVSKRVRSIEVLALCCLSKRSDTGVNTRFIIIPQLDHHPERRSHWWLSTLKLLSPKARSSWSNSFHSDCNYASLETDPEVSGRRLDNMGST